MCCNILTKITSSKCLFFAYRDGTVKEHRCCEHRCCEHRCCEGAPIFVREEITHCLEDLCFKFTIYPSADLPSIFIKHITNKVEKPRANIDSEHVISTLVTGRTSATFSSLEKVSQLTVKDCILISAPKSCELDPIPSKLLIEYLDSTLPSLTDLFNSSLYLASSHTA